MPARIVGFVGHGDFSTYNSGLSGLNLFQLLGMDPALLAAQLGDEQQLLHLQQVFDNFDRSQNTMAMQELRALLDQGEIPAWGYMPSPNASCCNGQGYAEPPPMFNDQMSPMLWSMLMSGGDAGLYQRFLMNDPFARQQL